MNNMMKKIIFLLASTAMLSSPLASHAQRKAKMNPNKYKKVLFAEVGTPGLGVTFNYDARFEKGKVNGLGGSAGLGLFVAPDFVIASLPLGFNFLMGTRNSFFEMGVVVTPFMRSVETFRNYNYDSYSGGYDTDYVRKEYYGIGISPIFGWRFQPATEGFFFAAGVSPFFSLNSRAMSNIPIGGYIRFGYSF